MVGGTRINWGTIPSKTLRESALFVYALTRRQLHGIRTEIAEEITVADFMYRERQVVQRELELINELARPLPDRGPPGPRPLRRPAHGGGRRRARPDPGRAAKGRSIVIATGSPQPPARRPLRPGVRLRQRHHPRAAAHAALDAGARRRRDRHRVRRDLRRPRPPGHPGRHPRPSCCPTSTARSSASSSGSCAASASSSSTTTATGPSSRVDGDRRGCAVRPTRGNALEADVLLYCVGRDGNTDDLGLEALGLAPERPRSARGQRALPDRAAPHLRGGRRDRLPGPGLHLDGAGAPGDPPRASACRGRGPHRGPALRHLRHPRGELHRRHRGGAEGEGRRLRRRPGPLRV